MLLLSGLVASMAFALITWALPQANQAFRVATYRANGGRPVTLTRGPMETGWAALRQQIQDLRRTEGGRSAAASLEYAFQLRLAIVVAAVPLGLAGVAIATCGFGRRWPLITAVGVTAGYWVLLMIQESAAKTLMNTAGFIPQYLCPWTPNIVMLLIASALIYSSMPPEPSTEG
jgi:lipopolysaccharide export LptBFGC system permease protein LptF